MGMQTYVRVSSPTPGLPHEIPAHELRWLAGLLEGEGSFLKGPPSAPRHPMIAVQMTDEDVIARVAAMFGRKPGHWQPPQARWQATYSARITGAKAAAWMKAADHFGTSIWCIYDLRGDRTHKHLARS